MPEQTEIGRLEVELEGELRQADITDVYTRVMGPRIIMDFDIPKSFLGYLANYAIERGYKPDDKIKYKITFEITE